MSQDRTEQPEQPDSPVATGPAGAVSDEELAEIEAERERRLDPANRPDGAEVDNTGQPHD